MVFAICLGLLGFAAALGLKSVWYPVLAILLLGNVVLYGMALSVEDSVDTGLLMTFALLLSLGIAGFHALFLNRYRSRPENQPAKVAAPVTVVADPYTVDAVEVRTAGAAARTITHNGVTYYERPSKIDSLDLRR